MTSRDFRTSALHDVDMAGMPVHIAAGRVGGANEAQLLDVDTASGLQGTPGWGVVGSAVLALALYALNDDTLTPDAFSSQAGRLDS
jgi:hypothetical protein